MNKLEKYISDKWVANIEKYNNIWVMNIFYPNELTFELEKTIPKSLEILEKMTPDSNFDENELIYRLKTTVSNTNDMNPEFIISPPENARFAKGEEVKLDVCDKSIVVDFTEDHKFYIVKSTFNDETSINKVEWMALNKIENETPEFSTNTGNFFTFSHVSLSSILKKKYHFGMDLNPDYQRDLVWNDEQKTNLIDSIFQNIEIGKFLLNHRGYSENIDNMYEVIDGKQRISAICDFYECRWAYRGVYFNELNWKDKREFVDFYVSLAVVQKAKKSEIYQYFINQNVGGVSVTKDHIKKVKKLLADELKNNNN